MVCFLQLLWILPFSMPKSHFRFSIAKYADKENTAHHTDFLNLCGNSRKRWGLLTSRSKHETEFLFLNFAILCNNSELCTVKPQNGIFMPVAFDICDLQCKVEVTETCHVTKLLFCSLTVQNYGLLNKRISYVSYFLLDVKIPFCFHEKPQFPCYIRKSVWWTSESYLSVYFAIENIKWDFGIENGKIRKSWRKQTCFKIKFYIGIHCL